MSSIGDLSKISPMLQFGIILLGLIMFEQLTDKLQQAFKTIRGQSRFTKDNMEPALEKVEESLLEADVSLSTTKDLLEKIKTQALGQAVDLNLNPEQQLIKIIHAELVHILGDTRSELNFKTQPPAVFLLAGLQGSGKTTSAAKLARYIQQNENKKVMLVSLDVYRPAAMDQLAILAKQIEADFFPASPQEKPLVIAKNALAFAKKNFMDVVIFDTAGRLHVDADMMDEIKSLHTTLNPIETLFVVDSMTGQDAAVTAKAFHTTIPLTGVILTKIDGDARGGAALSIKDITGQPIKFIGHGEKLDALEAFYPDRIASRILGMGDILTLIEEVERKADKKASEKLAKKIKKGIGFDLEDFKEQLLQMNNMGGIQSIMSKLPTLGQLPSAAANQLNDKSIKQTIDILNSMTLKERRFPQLIMNSGSRRQRIAKGSGTQPRQVNALLKQYEKMQKMLGKLAKPGAMKKMMRGIGGLPGFSNIKDILGDK